MATPAVSHEDYPEGNQTRKDWRAEGSWGPLTIRVLGREWQETKVEMTRVVLGTRHRKLSFILKMKGAVKKFLKGNRDMLRFASWKNYCNSHVGNRLEWGKLKANRAPFGKNWSLVKVTCLASLGYCMGGWA